MLECGHHKKLDDLECISLELVFVPMNANESALCPPIVHPAPNECRCPSKLSKATLPMQNQAVRSLTTLMSIITETNSRWQTGWGLHFGTYMYRLVFVYNEPTHYECIHYVVIMIQPRVYVLLPSTCWMWLMWSLRWICAAANLITTKLSFQDIYICWTSLKQTDTSLADDTQRAKKWWQVWKSQKLALVI